MPQRELELGAQQRERSAQLVACVRDEAALAREGSLQPAEHLVQRLAEPPELVARRRDGQPAARDRTPTPPPPRGASTRPAGARLRRPQ